MRLAVLLDAVGEAAQAPVLALPDRALFGLELGGDGIGERLDLRLGDVVARDQHAFVEWHRGLPSDQFNPTGRGIPGAATCERTWV